MKDVEESITDANNVTADAFSRVSSLQRENLDAIFTGENLDKSDELVDAINNSKIKDSIYELKIATTSDAQGDLTSNPDTVTHTSNGILDEKLLSFWSIEDVSVLPPLMNPKIRPTPQMLLNNAVKEIFADATSGNAWTNRTLRQISRTGVDGSIPISTPIHTGMRKSSTPSYSDNDGTRGTGTGTPIGTTSPPYGLNVSPKIDDIRQSATPDLRKSNKLKTSID